jgi:hypothetical protein
MESSLRKLGRDHPFALDLGKIPDPAQEAIGDARGA